MPLMRGTTGLNPLSVLGWLYSIQWAYPHSLSNHGIHLDYYCYKNWLTSSSVSSSFARLTAFSSRSNTSGSTMLNCSIRSCLPSNLKAHKNNILNKCEIKPNYAPCFTYNHLRPDTIFIIEIATFPSHN